MANLQNQMTLNKFDEELYDEIATTVRALQHHGIAGQKWGRQHGPPYPLARSASKKIRSGQKISKSEAKALREKDKAVKRINKAVAKKEKQEKREARNESRSAERILRKKAKYAKTAKSLYKHRSMYSQEEIENCLKKFEWEGKIKDYKQKDFTRAKNSVATFSDFSKSVVSIGKNAVEVYNLVAALDKTFGEGTMKRIELSPKNDKDKDKEKD